MLDMLSEKHLTEMGLNVGEKLHFQLEVSRLNLFHYPPLPPSLKAALFQRELESQLAHLPLVEEGVELLDHTVYRNPTCIDGPTVIVPAYMEIRITALKNMNVNHLHYGIHLTFDLSLRTGGLPQSVRDHIIQDLSLQVNEACMPMSELNCNTVEEAGDIKITGHIAADSHVILFAGCVRVRSRPCMYTSTTLPLAALPSAQTPLLPPINIPSASARSTSTCGWTFPSTGPC